MSAYLPYPTLSVAEADVSQSEVPRKRDLPKSGVQPVSRQYPNPPVIEAVCEFRLPPDSEWDLTVPGLVYEHIRDQVPTEGTERSVQGIELERTP